MCSITMDLLAYGSLLVTFYTLEIISITLWLLASWGPFYYGFTLILAWISYYINYNMWDKIIYQFPNSDGAPVKFGCGYVIPSYI